jgi:hypothetical protein
MFSDPYLCTTLQSAPRAIPGLDGDIKYMILTYLLYRMGAMHGYEIEYMFGLPYRLPQLYSNDELDVERAFSSKIMQFWGDFSRNK